MASQQELDHNEEEEEDFSFPTTTSSPPRFIGSPQLWRSPSNSLYLLEEPSGDNDQKKKKKINLFSSYIKSKDGGGGNDENMDVIWEDLNYEEEICGFIETEFDRPDELGGRRRRSMVKVGGGKRLSLVVLVNVLKKLFVLHNASRKLDR